MKNGLKIVAINLLLLILFAGGLEVASRIMDWSAKSGGRTVLELNLQPYMMFSFHRQKDPVWVDTLSDTTIPSTLSFNNYGFAEEGDFSLWPEDGGIADGGPNVRTILITGGSVVHGVGATANENTIAGQLQRILNQSQDRYTYRVVNLGMGSWIAYQQFVGLSLFGVRFDPDWVVVMDGHNDGAVPCSHGSGPGNPLGWPKMLYLAGGGDGIENQSAVVRFLLENSALARMVSGIDPDAHNREMGRVYFDRDDPDQRFDIKLSGNTVGGLDDQVRFYIASQRNVANLFHQANILFSSQPLMYGNALGNAYRDAFSVTADESAVQSARARLKDALDTYMADNRSVNCDTRVASQTLGYFMGRSAIALEGAAAEWDAESDRRSVSYLNAEYAMPLEPHLRKPHFIDNAHMTDLGQRMTAELFAEHILEKDTDRPFDAAQRYRDMHRQAVRSSAEEGYIFDVSATYGRNCGVPDGNVSEAVIDACQGKMSCTFTVDVTVLGDPAGGCGKAFDAEWSCAEDDRRQVSLPPEAGLPPHNVTLTCF